MAPPRCRHCGLVECTVLESAELRLVWQSEELVAWSWVGSVAYWHYCLDWHQRLFPLYNRCRNRHCRPCPDVVTQLSQVLVFEVNIG